MRQLVRSQESNQIRSHRKFRCFVTLAVVLSAMLIGCSQEAKKPAALRSLIDASDTLQLRALEGTGIYLDGWVGGGATIFLGNPHHTRLLSVSGTNVQTGMKDERLLLRVAFQSGRTDSLEIAQTGTFDQLLLMPAADGVCDTVRFRLTPTKTFVPSRIGTSKDDRTLSFMLAKIGLVDPAALSATMPESFEFPRQAEKEPNLAGVYKDGWIADSGLVTLHNLHGKKSVEIRGFAPPDVFSKIADLEIRLNGVLLVKEQIPRQNQGYFNSVIQLPEEFTGTLCVPLMLKPSGAFVPAQRGINADQRRISFQLQYIGLK